MLRAYKLALVLLFAGAFGGSWAVAQEATRDRIQAAKSLRVCIWPDYFGISYRDPKTQQLSGIDVDMAKALGRELGVNVEFVDSSFAKLIPDVLENRCDIAMFAIGITPLRQEKLRFTKPHLASDIYAITTKSNRRIKVWSDIDRSGVVVAVAKGTLHEPLMKERLKAATLKVLDTPHAREQEVESGRADVFMTDFPYSQRMLRTTDWARLIKPETTYHITRYAWAMRPGDYRWHARVEAFLAQAKQRGELKATAERHGLLPIVLLDY
ncbi:ABC transporter substrate-binding protein [Dechloromonas sp.]|uniref:ABC transporter substrate-binding protein n=1 Tax=Dechloromonas sp. TaxID=1917218 RepID=UPI00120336C9|nr:ABC transporter substrate-binding protein [Dechloromonas sp.]MBU3697300.1 amino acid ABC transporter substrate-binding protein [Dechloromonas sp.]TEX44430.1 MAG: amino acid ABC transporter substrate-binding protein [Rhodocyclaceae bacterium]